jgi:hypothetical protein
MLSMFPHNVLTTAHNTCYSSPYMSPYRHIPLHSKKITSTKLRILYFLKFCYHTIPRPYIDSRFARISQIQTAAMLMLLNGRKSKSAGGEWILAAWCSYQLLWKCADWFKGYWERQTHGQDDNIKLDRWDKKSCCLRTKRTVECTHIVLKVGPHFSIKTWYSPAKNGTHVMTDTYTCMLHRNDKTRKSLLHFLKYYPLTNQLHGVEFFLRSWLSLS